ncbi:MAG: hypothetical protein H0U21_09435, partial [Acidimicrobiia bacterium]|nr:hypothetical protein [Acidimicrobiia bacterium]
RESVSAAVAAGASAAQTASCNAGEVATGGGCEMTGAASTQFEASINGAGTAYTCRMRNDTGVNQTITAQVVCQANGVAGGGSGGGGTTDHTLLTNIGTNTHPQLDAHLAATGTAVHGLGPLATAGFEPVLLLGGM